MPSWPVPSTVPGRRRGQPRPAFQRVDQRTQPVDAAPVAHRPAAWRPARAHRPAAIAQTGLPGTEGPRTRRAPGPATGVLRSAGAELRDRRRLPRQHARTLPGGDRHGSRLRRPRHGPATGQRGPGRPRTQAAGAVLQRQRDRHPDPPGRSPRRRPGILHRHPGRLQRAGKDRDPQPPELLRTLPGTDRRRLPGPGAAHRDGPQQRRDHHPRAHRAAVGDG